MAKATIAQKKCSRCLKIKPVADFYWYHRDGYSGSCKLCDALRKSPDYQPTPKPAKVICPVIGKTCSLCKQALPWADFYKDRRSPDGYTPKCKECKKPQIYAYAKTANGRAASKRFIKKWSATPTGKEKISGYQKKYKASKGGYRPFTLRGRGLTAEHYNKLLLRQKGCCAICGVHESTYRQIGSKRHFAIDHDHDTGKIRGLLCNSCNLGIGALGDNPIRLRAAVRYLKFHANPLSETIGMDEPMPLLPFTIIT